MTPDGRKKLARAIRQEKLRPVIVRDPPTEKKDSLLAVGQLTRKIQDQIVNTLLENGEERLDAIESAKELSTMLLSSRFNIPDALDALDPDRWRMKSVRRLFQTRDVEATIYAAKALLDEVLAKEMVAPEAPADAVSLRTDFERMEREDEARMKLVDRLRRKREGGQIPER